MPGLTRALLLTLALTACAAPAPPPGLRDTDQPIYSSAAFDPAVLTGTWVQVADLTRRPDCDAGGMTVSPQGKGWQVAWQFCLNGKRDAGQGALHMTGPGRFALPGLATPVWVLWVDADARTLVLGTPSGAFGLILDRDAIPADRLQAARDVLRWNGYDTAALNRF